LPGLDPQNEYQAQIARFRLWAPNSSLRHLIRIDDLVQNPFKLWGTLPYLDIFARAVSLLVLGQWQAIELVQAARAACVDFVRPPFIQRAIGAHSREEGLRGALQAKIGEKGGYVAAALDGVKGGLLKAARNNIVPAGLLKANPDRPAPKNFVQNIVRRVGAPNYQPAREEEAKAGHPPLVAPRH
jgi:hypothetical protein